MEIWKYNYKDGGFELAPELNVDLGCFDFMEQHYTHYSSLPEFENEAMGQCPTSGMTIWEVNSESRGQLPPYVVDLQYGDGDTLCFRAAWELWQWFSSVMPMILHVKRWNARDF